MAPRILLPTSLGVFVFALASLVVSPMGRQAIAKTGAGGAVVYILPNGDAAPIQEMSAPGVANVQPVAVSPADWSPLGVVVGIPSMDAAQIDAVLASYNSPAQGTGGAWYEAGLRHGIDPAYAVAFFVQESTAGTNPAWAGIKSDGGYTHNVGNIICAGYTTCYGRFREYPDWSSGIEDWFRLIRVEYIDGRKLTDVGGILQVYAPPVENDTGAYVDTVNSLVATWRAQGQPAQTQGTVSAPPLALTGCLGTNVRAAMGSSPGLRDVTIAPGGDWSFNEHWIIANVVECGVIGGGVCNQASRYSYVARQLGLDVQSVYHGFDYDNAVPSVDNVAIWSSGGRGGQDLVIRNTTSQVVRLQATIEGDQLNVVGWKE